MQDYYLILVIILGILAIADLMVGVSNDAVNFSYRISQGERDL